MARITSIGNQASASLAARLGMKDWQVDRARRDLTGWNETSLGMAVGRRAGGCRGQGRVA
ncbi:hypothetical protein [Microbacterium aurum]